MSNIVCYIFLGFFIIVGISDIMEYLITRFFKIENLNSYEINSENIEYISRAVLLQNSKNKNRKFTLNIKNDSTDELRKIYSVLCKDYSKLLYYTDSKKDFISKDL